MAGIWTIDKIKSHARRAEKGDLKALEDLRAYNNQQAVNANKRIIRFEKAGETSPALQMAMQYTKQAGHGSRFTRSKKITIKELESQLLALRKFNTAKTGSLKGLREYQKESITRLEEQLGITIPKDKLPEVEIFLQSELFNEYKQFDSERALEEGIDAIIRGVSIERMQEAWESYQSGDDDLIEAFDKFVEVDESEIDDIFP